MIPFVDFWAKIYISQQSLLSDFRVLAPEDLRNIRSLVKKTGNNMPVRGYPWVKVLKQGTWLYTVGWQRMDRGLWLSEQSRRSVDRTHTNRKQKKILLDYLHLEFLTSFLGPLPQVLPFLTAFFISPEAWVYSSPTVSGAAGITCPKYICRSPSATNI